MVNKIFYYTPNMNTPSGGMGVLFKQARILKDNGYDVTLLYEGNNVLNPVWMDFSILDIPKQKISGILNTKIDKDSLLVIPEGFGNIIEQTRNVAYKRVVLAQSWIYILNSMSKPVSWKDYGIKDVISVSGELTKYINTIMPGMNIHDYRYSIKTNYFNPDADKEPRICFSSRGQESEMKVNSIINMFRILTPKYKNIQFVHLRGYDKQTFANILSESIITLYTDEIACVATLPLESMAANTYVVGWDNGTLDYSNEGNMTLVKNGDCQALGKKLSEMVTDYYTGNLPDLRENYKKTLELYSEQQEKDKILEIFRILFKNRII